MRFQYREHVVISAQLAQGFRYRSRNGAGFFGIICGATDQWDDNKNSCQRKQWLCKKMTHDDFSMKKAAPMVTNNISPSHRE
jgi:hypothetical protein